MQYETMNQIRNYDLQKAVNILNEYGQDIFDGFCHEKDFSYCDINRCIAKCKILFNRDDLAERPIPDNLKQARWHHYTKIARYPDKKAAKLLRAIDESYKNQFDAKFDLKFFANRIGK